MNNADWKKTWMTEHTKMCRRINQLCEDIQFGLKVVIYFSVIAILFGGLIAFTVFLWLYNKGIIQRWLM